MFCNHLNVWECGFEQEMESPENFTAFTFRYNAVQEDDIIIGISEDFSLFGLKVYKRKLLTFLGDVGAVTSKPVSGSFQRIRSPIHKLNESRLKLLT